MPRILIIDDRADVRRAIEAILKARGYTSRSAGGGREGLDLMRTHHFDAVVVDIFMPDLDGIATIQLMKADFPELPVIAISGHAVQFAAEGGIDFLKMAVEHGASASLRKPFTPAQLMDAVDCAIHAPKRDGSTGMLLARSGGHLRSVTPSVMAGGASSAH
ncbi:response regulator [Jiella mangrovi]|nr:response regulator [Jiella mangrovi]